jgi:hypothetical protein
MPHAAPTPPVDALSLGRRTARRGAPSSRATCYLHCATCYAHSAGGCPVFRDAGLRVQLQYPPAEDASHTSPVDAPSLSGMMARRGAPSSHATCYLHRATCYAHSAGGCPVFRDASLRVQLQYPRAEDASHTPPVDAPSFCGMMARRGAPSSRATCYLHRATCYAHSAGGCPVFRDAGLRVQLQYPRAEDASHTPPVDAPSLAGMMARRGAPSSHATCYLHRATYYAHSAGGCPVFRDASLRVQLQYPQAEDASPTLLLDTPSHGGMMAHRGAPSSCATCYLHHAVPTLQVDALVFT